MGRHRRRGTVLDTWAMLAYLDGEPAAHDVRQVLRRARGRLVPVFFSIISYGETLYIVEREQGRQQAQRAIGVVDQLPLHVVPAERSLVCEAAHVKARFRLSYADSFSVAVAVRTHSHVMTGDPEFRSVESEVAIDWLPDRRR